MLKQKNIFLLCLFLSIGAFFSCGDAVGTDINENDIEIVTLLFFKIHNNDEFNLPSTSWEIIDCMVGDTIGLMCGLPDWNNLPEFVTARITTSGGDIEFVKLLNDPLASYFMSVPPPQPM